MVPASVAQRNRANGAKSAAASAFRTETRVKASVADLSSSVGAPSVVSALGPISLIGGTAAVYASVLRHPSSTLTPLSMMYLVLLALQYTLQPRFSRRYIHPKTNKKAVALAEEVVKTSMAAVLYVTSSTNRRDDLASWTLKSSLAVAGLPAVLYAIQGVLQYTSYQYLDPVTFNGLSQTKTISAALCCFLILGKRQSAVQMVALVMLLGSALLFQKKQTAVVATGRKSSTTAAAAFTYFRNKNWFLLGVIPCVMATFLSGLAGALSQKGLQLAGGTGRDAFFFTIEISFFSALTLFLSMWKDSKKVKKADKSRELSDVADENDTTTSLRQGFQFFQHTNKDPYWTTSTWIPIVCKATGGVLTALVHKHAGSVAKGFALLAGLVCSGLIQSWWGTTTTTTRSRGDNDDVSSSTLSPHQTIATLLCLWSGWLHFTHPPK